MSTLFPQEVTPPVNSLPEAEQNALVLSCEKLCRRLARVAAATNPAHDVDDLEQEAMLACVEASRRWSPTAGTKFSTYATACINRHLAGVTTRHRGEGTVHLESWESIADDKAGSSAPARVLSPQQEYLLSRLTETAYLAVSLVVVDGCNPTQVADRLGLSVKDTKLILRNAALELSKELRKLDKPALFDATPEAEPWATFARALSEVEAEFALEA